MLSPPAVRTPGIGSSVTSCLSRPSDAYTNYLLRYQSAHFAGDLDLALLVLYGSLARDAEGAILFPLDSRHRSARHDVFSGERRPYHGEVSAASPDPARAEELH